MDFFKVLALGVILPAAIFFGVVGLRDRPVEQELTPSELSGGFVGLPSANGSPTLELVAVRDDGLSSGERSYLGRPGHSPPFPWEVGGFPPQKGIGM